MELEQGKIITGKFVIDKISVNEHFVDITLNDGTTKIQGVLKDNIDLFSKTYKVGDEIICKGKVRKKRKNYCLDLIYITQNMLDSQINNKFDVQKIIDRFYELVESISDDDYKRIIDNCFNEDVKELYFTYPASKNRHHNYMHGLVQHSVEVVDISLLISNYFKNVNRDLIVCSGLLHDIGKLKSYDMEENSIIKTDWDLLLGHLPMSSLFVSKITPVEIDQDKIMLLYHSILSHHGENGPTLCKTKEAYILNKADEISSTMNQLDMLKYDENGWSKTETNGFWFKG